MVLAGKKCLSISLILMLVLYIHLIVITRPQAFVSAEEVDEDDYSENPDNDVDDESDNDRDVTEPFYEPFDPEKNGFLLHEYYTLAYQKYPDYDAAAMKQNLNYFGDILLYEKGKDTTAVADATEVGDRFVLDPEEKELYLRVNESNNDIQEGESIEPDGTSDVEDSQGQNGVINWSQYS